MKEALINVYLRGGASTSQPSLDTPQPSHQTIHAGETPPQSPFVHILILTSVILTINTTILTTSSSMLTEYPSLQSFLKFAMHVTAVTKRGSFNTVVSFVFLNGVVASIMSFFRIAHQMGICFCSYSVDTFG